MAQVKPVNKKKMTKPALIATIVAVVILVAFAVSVLSSSGLFVRMQEGASTENFKINGAMINYFAQAAIENWYQNDYVEMLKDMYGDYYQLFMQYNMGPFNPELPYNEQVYDSPTGKTFADLFVEVSGEYVSRLLSLCEAAKADSAVNYAEIEADAKASAKSSIDTLKAAAKASGLDFATYINAYIAKNMNASDLEKCLVIEQIANTYATKYYDRVFEGLTSDEKVEFFKDNIGSFFTAGYMVYTLANPETVEFPVAEDYDGGEESKAYKAAKEAAEKNKTDAPNVEDYKGGAESKAYKAAYDEAVEAKEANDKQIAIDKAAMAELEKATSAEEFKRILLGHAYDKAFDSAYDSISSKLGDSKPSDEELAQFKATVKNQIIDAVINGKTTIEAEKVESENATEWEKSQATLPTSVITKLTSTLNAAQQTTTFSITSSIGQKLFGGVKAEYGVPYKSYEVQGENAKVGDVWSEDAMISNKNSIVKAIEIYKDMLNDPENDKEEIESAIKSLEDALKDAEEEIANVDKTGHYTYSAFFVTEAAHREDAKTRDVGHILFGISDAVGEGKNTYKTSAEAKKAATTLYEELKTKAVNGVITKELFEEYATGKTADSGIFYDDVYVGQMQPEFEEWLFAAEKVGELGLVETDFGWHIMYYGGEGEEATWEHLAHLAASNEKYAEWEEELNYNVSVNTALLTNYFKNR